ncbi:phosphatases II [Basidiobolus meristosporus CBS 931.73]|uniref:Protein tyrosine phosphatase type IVA 3 n=1 Tax=Basidiobolus meristosporus CBS 931.73 TaxID=1314790 RepID=A0A1Y1Z5R8_9FUNG|nr:phosphatases II [Basidiobolus meristosporus CBS 931.73]|eukprot:ORY05599.1 phosphatases II [Basidiobolus meristosporus CBS 931.73]
MLYSITVCTIIIIRLRSARRSSMSFESAPSSGVKDPKVLTRAVIRISLYPLILCIVGIPFVFIMIIQLSTQSGYYISSYYTCEYSIALLGVLNGIAFVFDPVLYHCCSQIRRDLVTRYRVEEQYVVGGGFNFRRWFTRVFLLPKDADSESTLFSTRDDSMHWKSVEKDEETLHCPSDKTLPNYIPKLLEHGVKDLVRISDADNNYNIRPLEEVGINVHDEMKFDDGSVPSKTVVDNWLNLIYDNFANEEAIAVHCVSGIGRAPVLVTIALIELGMDSLDAIEYVRKQRRGALNRKQIAFLDSYKPRGGRRKSKGFFKKLFGKS